MRILIIVATATLLAAPAAAQSPGDRDGDGVLDYLDACPREPEDLDQIRDHDGCPDGLPAGSPPAADDSVSDDGAAGAAYRPADTTVVLPLRRASAPVQDGDMVFDSEDLCPGLTEDRDGFEDEDGCPDPDNDGDRIADPDDACPLEAETVNGRLDDDGCPDAPAADPAEDADGDGLHVFVDLCPDAPEDPDGFEDADGCPDPDNDGDGIADHVDRCPLEAESANDLRDADGCPDGGNDYDKDLVDDAFDLCPKEPEDRDGIRDVDGCPELASPETIIAERIAALEKAKAERDAAAAAEAERLAALGAALPPLPVGTDVDGDGFDYYADACPEEPEDVDGNLDGDGCPDPDDDGDGIADVDDACPREAESFNDFDDDDGCFDVKPDILDSLSGVVRGIQFRSGSSVLLRRSDEVLTQVLELLQEHDHLAISITGHTDDQGADDTNVALSQARADAVAAWLHKRGIEDDRLATAGVGAAQPVEDNATDQGRAANRRVELSYRRRGPPEGSTEGAAE